MNKLAVMILCLALILCLTACSFTKGNESKPAGSNDNLQITPGISSQSTEASETTVANAESVSSGQIKTSSEKTDSRPLNSGNAEFNEQKYQKLGEKLLKELEKNKASCLTFFDVANKLSYRGYESIENVSKFQKIEPCAEIKNAGKISEFKKSLKLDQWKAEMMQLKSMPKVFIYFDNNLHVNLEGQVSTGKAWMSINSPAGSVYYSVPKNVYETILQKYKDKK